MFWDFYRCIFKMSRFLTTIFQKLTFHLKSVTQEILFWNIYSDDCSSPEPLNSTIGFNTSHQKGRNQKNDSSQKFYSKLQKEPFLFTLKILKFRLWAVFCSIFTKIEPESAQRLGFGKLFFQDTKKSRGVRKE